MATNCCENLPFYWFNKFLIILGATVQYSGKDKKTGKIVEVAREGVVKISGQNMSFLQTIIKDD